MTIYGSPDQIETHGMYLRSLHFKYYYPSLTNWDQSEMADLLQAIFLYYLS